MTGQKIPFGKRRNRGFQRASLLVQDRIRGASESKGFAVSRLLTHWADIVGADIAKCARPVEITYGRKFGATLTVLTTGAQAPMLEMQKEQIRERVNACYGYSAISEIRLTQTAATGFSEGQAVFSPAPENTGGRLEPRPVPQAAVRAASGVASDELRQALERLGANVLSETKQ